MPNQLSMYLPHLPILISNDLRSLLNHINYADATFLRFLVCRNIELHGQDA